MLTQTVCQNISATTLSVTAYSGLPLNYQWYKNTNNSISGSTLISGANSPSLTPSTSAAGTLYYYCVVGGNSCTAATITSNISTITVTQLPSGGIISGSTSLCSGTSGVTYSISGVSNATSYIWALPSGANITGGSGTSQITVSWGSTSGNVYCTPTNNGACTVNGTNLYVNVNPIPSAGTISGSSTVCSEASGISYSAIGAANVTSFYWTTPSGSTITGGSGSSSITVTWGNSGGNITCIPLNGNCTATGTTLSVTINNAPLITNPSNVTVCPNSNTSFSVTGSGTGNLSYQWYVSTDGVNYNPITTAGSSPSYSGFTSSTITLTGVVAGNDNYYYKCVLSGPSPCTTAASSTAATLTVTTSTTINGPNPSNPSICSGQSASFTVTAGGSGLSYQWQANGSNISGSGSQSIYSGYISNSGASSSTLSISNVTGLNNYTYDCVVTGSCGSPNVSSAATLTVIPGPTFSSAGASIYSSSWTTGQNDDNSNVFGAWNLTTSGGTGTFFTDGYATKILTNSRAWGIYDNGGQANAIRPISASFSVGNTLNFSMENGTIQTGGTVGFNLQNSSGQNLMQFYFAGRQTNYTLNDGTATLNTSIGFTTTGFNIAIAYTAANTYSIAITPTGGSTSYFIGRSFISQSNEVPNRLYFSIITEVQLIRVVRLIHISTVWQLIILI